VGQCGRVAILALLLGAVAIESQRIGALHPTSLFLPHGSCAPAPNTCLNAPSARGIPRIVHEKMAVAMLRALPKYIRWARRPFIGRNPTPTESSDAFLINVSRTMIVLPCAQALKQHAAVAWKATRIEAREVPYSTRSGSVTAWLRG
jgi:hypothetical protein